MWTPPLLPFFHCQRTPHPTVLRPPRSDPFLLASAIESSGLIRINTATITRGDHARLIVSLSSTFPLFLLPRACLQTIPISPRLPLPPTAVLTESGQHTPPLASSSTQR